MYEDLADSTFIVGGLADSWWEIPFLLTVVVCLWWVPADGCEKLARSRDAPQFWFFGEPGIGLGYGWGFPVTALHPNVIVCRACTHNSVEDKALKTRQTDILNHSYHVKHTGKGRKLDHSMIESKGAANESRTCAVPMQTPQTSSLWRGVGEVSSAFKVECERRVQPSPLKACQEVLGLWYEY